MLGGLIWKRVAVDKKTIDQSDWPILKIKTTLLPLLLLLTLPENPLLL